MKAFARRVLFWLGLLIAAGALAAGGVYVYRIAVTPTLARSGGTVLVYEVDGDAARAGGAPPDYRPEDLAEAVKRRVNPTGWDGVTVRPVDLARVEVAVSRAGDHAAHVQQIKDLMAQQGSLEFRIVANRHKDGVAFEAARVYFIGKDNEAKRKQDLQRAAESGLPPPAPAVPEGEAQTTYSWVEIGRTERAALGLNNTAKGGQRWEEAAKAREKGEPFVIEYPAGGRNEEANGTTSMMLWSRKCENLRLSPAERDEKAFEYFLFVRDPAAPDQAITGRYLINAQASDAAPGSPTVEFTFNAAGGRLFGQLTGDNLPAGREPVMQFSSICIILDGHVVSAPSLNSAIYERGQIVGQFTVEEARRLAQILRAGALPVPLKPVPVIETIVEPK